jgi:hypothetical protein
MSSCSLCSGAMRVIITARQSLTPSHQGILTKLVNILGEISKNPSNPKFNQYCFESVSALIRYVGQAHWSPRRELIEYPDSCVRALLPRFRRLSKPSSVQHRSFSPTTYQVSSSSWYTESIL